MRIPVEFGLISWNNNYLLTMNYEKAVIMVLTTMMNQWWLMVTRPEALRQQHSREENQKWNQGALPGKTQESVGGNNIARKQAGNWWRTKYETSHQSAGLSSFLVAKHECLHIAEVSPSWPESRSEKASGGWGVTFKLESILPLNLYCVRPNVRDRRSLLGFQVAKRSVGQKSNIYSHLTLYTYICI